MLAEKFVLVLEMILKGQAPSVHKDGAPRVVTHPRTCRYG